MTKKTLKIRQLPPERFSKFRTTQIQEGIKAIIGIETSGNSQVQSFHFDPDMYPLVAAKNWVKDYNTKIKERFGLVQIGLKENSDVQITNGPVGLPTETKSPVIPNESKEPDLEPDRVFDIVHASNGKLDKNKVLNELNGLKKLESFLDPKVFNKMTAFLKAKMKESVLNENGFNLQEGDSTFVADSFDISLKESVNDTSLRKAKVRLIKSGESKNGFIYSGKCLKDGAHLFEGLPIYPNHVDGERPVEDKVGFYSNVQFVGSDEDGELQATANIFESEKKIWDLIKEQSKNPEAKLCGFSINAYGKGRILQEGSATSKKKRIVDSLVHADSTDIVSNPSAGGKVLELLESVKNSYNSSNPDLGEESMDEKTLREKYPDLVKLIEASSKDLVLKEAEEVAKEEAKKTQKCPHCEKEFPMKESVEHMNVHISETTLKLTESASTIQTLTREVNVNKLKESVSVKLKEDKFKNLPDATKVRLAESLLSLGDETREGEKPSNWDLKITEELNYVKQVRGSKEDLVLASDSEKKPETKLSVEDAKSLAREISRNL